MREPLFHVKLAKNTLKKIVSEFYRKTEPIECLSIYPSTDLL